MNLPPQGIAFHTAFGGYVFADGTKAPFDAATLRDTCPTNLQDDLQKDPNDPSKCVPKNTPEEKKYMDTSWTFHPASMGQNDYVRLRARAASVCALCKVANARVTRDAPELPALPSVAAYVLTASPASLLR